MPIGLVISTHAQEAVVAPSQPELRPVAIQYRSKRPSYPGTKEPGPTCRQSSTVAGPVTESRSGNSPPPVPPAPSFCDSPKGGEHVIAKLIPAGVQRGRGTRPISVEHQACPIAARNKYEHTVEGLATLLLFIAKVCDTEEANPSEILDTTYIPHIGSLEIRRRECS